MTNSVPSSRVDPQQLDGWLSELVEGVIPPLALELIAGGRSNLTYRVTDAAGRKMALRRPPRGHVLESAHDVAREYRLILALAPTPVPVPTALALCDDARVIGAPFYVMDFVEGLILRTETDVEQGLGTSARGTVSESLIDCLVQLHRLDPDAIGLGDLSRHGGYVSRQLRRWKAQFDAARTRDVLVIDEAHRRLSAAVPAQQRVAIVHGDYRLDNCIVSATGELLAVLDWELCTLGDPLADLGLLMVYWTRPGDDGPSLLTGLATALPGFQERADLVKRYVDQTGADVSQLPFFLALGYWKLACIFEGIYARYRAGVMGEDGTDAEQFADQAVELGAAALQALDGRGVVA